MEAVTADHRAGLGSALTGWLGKLAVVTIALVLWAFLAASLRSAFVPGPVAVAKTFVHVLTHGDATGISLVQHTWASLKRVLLGFAIAAAAGIPLGLLLGLNKALYQAASVVIDSVRFIPPLAWAPVAIMLMRGPQRYLFIISLGAFFPILLSTMSGVARVNPLHLEVVKVFGFDRLRRILKVVLPSALPEIVAGLRISLGISWGILVAAELIGAGVDGLGRMMLTHAELLQTDVVVLGMVLIGILGFYLNKVVLLLEARLFRWRQEIRL